MNGRFLADRKQGALARLVGLSVSLLLCACGSATAASDEAANTMLVETQGNTVDAHAQLEPAQSGSSNLQFDLDCKYQGKIMANPESRPTSSPYEPTFEGDLHLIVDLQAMQFCDVPRCRESGPSRLISAEDDMIVFHQWRHHDLSLIDTVRRSDGAYTQSIAGDDGYLLLTMGTCAVEPFSGFPSRAPERMIEDPAKPTD